MLALAALHIICLLLFALSMPQEIHSGTRTLVMFYVLTGLGMALYFVLVGLNRIF